MIDLYKIIVEKGGLFGIISITTIVLLTVLINAIKTSTLDHNHSYQFWIFLLKSIRILILVPTVFVFSIELYKVIDNSFVIRDIRNRKYREIEEELRKRQSQLEEEKKRQDQYIREQKEALKEKERRQVEELTKRQREIEAEKERQEEENKRIQAKIDEENKRQAVERTESIYVPRKSGLQNGDCCEIYHPYSNSALTLRSRTLSSYETSRMNQCRECSDSEYINEQTDIGDLSHGDNVIFLGKIGKWYKVKFGNKVGFMSASYSGSSTLRKC